MASLLSTAGLARASASRPWRTLAAWLIVLVLAAVLAPSLGDSLTTEMRFTNSPESQKGDDLLDARLRGPRPMTETVIVRSTATTADDPAFKARVFNLMAGLRAMPDVVGSVISPYDEGSAALISADRHTVLVPVTMVGDLDEATDNVERFQIALEKADGNGLEVLTVGDASMNEEFTTISEEDMAKGEQIGLSVAILILVVVFGALIAAGLPIALGLVSVFVAVGMAAVVGRFFELSFFVVNMIGMIGLAVGIDYALFVVSRYREERRRGHAKLDAIEFAGATASKAVLFSGGTVILALMGMFLVPQTIFHSLGLGAVLVVIVAVIATLTLIPAMLSLLGDRIDWPRRIKYDAAMAAKQAARDAEVHHAGFWGTVTRVVMARPVVSLVAAAAILIVALVPYFDLRSGSAGVSGLPEGTRTRAAYEILQRDFAAGMVTPVEIAVDGEASAPAVQGAIARLTSALDADPIAGPVTTTANAAGDLTLVSFPLTIAPDSPAAYDAIDRLRDGLIPTAIGDAPVRAYVTGNTALIADSNHQIAQYTPWVFAFVLGLSFLLLLVAFRSIVVPAKAIVMNLLSVGAAYGLIVLVFQKGVGAGLFGFQTTPAIESWLPLFLFCVLFGLSMDYHVFLLSRIREHYDVTKRNGESVAVGLQATAKIITGAATIMVAVFAGFAMGRLSGLQQVGFGLAAAVFLDATIVRSVLVPASMALLGDRNWYLPAWLEWLPNLQIEGGHVPAPAVAAEPVNEPVFAPAPLAPALATVSVSGDD